MNTREEIQAEIKRLQDKLDSMPVGLWKPEPMCQYFYISHGAVLSDIKNTGCMSDEFNILTGNCFKTREGAELYKKRLIVTQKLKELACGFVPDWSNRNQVKYYIFYDHQLNRFCSTWTYDQQLPNTVYLATKEQAEQAKEILGDDLKYLL